ncbi:MAG: hypothetical protein NVSMB52_07490 [Chloroflexota bacterium]
MRPNKKIVMILPIMVVVSLGLLMIPRSTGAQSAPALQGTILPPRTAPAFNLKDQFGRRITPASFRGQPVVLTFLSAACTQLCPTIAETLSRTISELGAAGKKVAIVAVSTAPEVDTTSVVRRFSMAHGVLHRWHFLNGPRNQLARVWKGYYIYAAPKNAPEKVRDAHTAATYLIDAGSRERVLIGGDPDPAVLRRDLAILLGKPALGGGVIGVPAPEAGHLAPDFALKTVAGTSVRLQGLHGRVVLLNFWATWCKPCRIESPRLEKWYRQLRDRGLTVIGVNAQEGTSDVKPFLQRYGLAYPIVLDTNGGLMAKYNVTGLPTSVLIDDHGTVVTVKLGALDDAFFVQHIVPLLRGKADG